MIEVTRAQLPKWVVRVKMDVDMSSTPPKVIEKEACLRAKGLFKLSKDLGPKRCPTILWSKNK
jgi:hypothetical protein